MIVVPKPEGSVHSRMGPSSLARIIACPPSVVLSEGAPDTGSEAADEGTAAHHIAALCLHEGREPWEFAGREVLIEETGRKFVVDEEMVLGVDTYLAETRRYQGPEYSVARTFVERRVSAPELHPEAFGTLDYGEALIKPSLLRVVDFKYGFLVVEPRWNPQLLAYAAYLWDQIGANHASIDEVELVIVQPRAPHTEGPVRRWRTTIDALGEWVHTVAVPAMRSADNPHEDPAPGRHCRYCPALLRCPSVEKVRGRLLSEAAKTEEITGTDETLARAQEEADILDWHGKRIRAESVRRAMAGRRLPGFKMVRQRTHRVWKDGAEDAVRARLGDKAYKSVLHTPAQIGKLAGGAALVSEYAFYPEGGLTLVSADDSREEVVVQAADPNEVFTKYTGEQ